MSSPQKAAQKSPSRGAAEAPGRDAAPAPQAAPLNPLWSRLATRPGAFPALQAKLTVGAPNDPYEQEADAVADRVMRMPAPGAAPLIQRKCAACAHEDEEKKGTVQAKETPGGVPALTPATEARIGGLRGGGEPLPAAVRADLEPRFGYDFGAVRVHTGSAAAATARDLSAQAYTMGRDIVFDSGRFAPSTSEGRRLLAHELTHVVQQQGDPSAPIRCFRVTRAQDVPSLVMGDWRTGRLPRKWADLRGRLARRDSTIATMLGLVTAGTPEHATLTRMSSRWGTFRRLAGSTTFVPASGRLPARAAITAAEADERTDIGALTGSRFFFVRDVARKFLRALDLYLQDRDTLADEGTEYHRFDSEFTHSVVTRLLRGVAHVRLRSAEVKAVVDQETGDLTNTTIAGITGKSAGILTSVPNPSTFVGLGQHSARSRTEGIAWAAAHGVTIPATPDPRTVPRQSIRLTAAYLGRVMDMLWAALPANKPTGDELKKMLFASYNGGASAVGAAARSFLAGTPGPYTWDNIKNEPTVTGQMRSYVAGIVRRLS